MLCHSVFSWRSPVPLSFQTSSVAMENRQNGVPLAVYFSSGSRPSRPTRITLFTDFAIQTPQMTFTLAGRCSPLGKLQLLKPLLCAIRFTGTGKPLHNFVQSGDCLLRSICVDDA